MTLRVSIRPEFFLWAIERSHKNPRQLRKKFKKIEEWIEGKTRPTLKQLEEFAKATYVPVGYFFLENPPQEDIPILDFRTIKNVEVSRPSPNLLDTIYLCQQRQDWCHDFVRSLGGEKFNFVGSIKKNMPIEKVAERMRHYFEIDLEKRVSGGWEEHLKFFIEKIRTQGVLVMVNGVVGSNVYRKLDVNEFRGFALSDDFAPLIFINGADSKGAQLFTLAHELAHIGLGKSALSNADLVSHPSNSTEVWCNKVAAEFLVPLKSIKEESIGNHPLQAVSTLVKRYKVSSLVIIRRLFDAEYIKRDEFEKAYKKEIRRLRKYSQRSGGDFYRTLETRVGNRFAKNVVVSTLQGQTSFTDALDLLGIKKMKTFDKIAKRMGILLE